MPGRVEVRERESVQQALRRLRHAVRHASRRQWHKPRPGYYLKPSNRRRNKETLRRRNARRPKYGAGNWQATVYLSQNQLFAAQDPLEYRRERWCELDASA